MRDSPTLDVLPAAGRVLPRQPDGLAALAPFSRQQSAADFAFGRLRQAIISLALPPGTVLSRVALAERLAVSQMPVREALVRLQEEDLVEVVPSSSTRVTRINLNSARQAHFLRLSLELEIVRRLSASPDPAFAARLSAQLASQRDMLEHGDQAALSEADEAFHGALYEAADLTELRRLVLSRSGHLDRLRRLHLPSPGKAAAILQEHVEIARLLGEGNAVGAEAALRRHFSGPFGTFANAEAIRAEHPEFF
jgi:DNA-binding GntR family transcriptional regulator